MGLALGELDAIKVDNMMEEFRERMAKKTEQKPVELKDYGMVSVSQGDGLAAIMADLGVDVVVDGGSDDEPLYRRHNAGHRKGARRARCTCSPTIRI